MGANDGTEAKAGEHGDAVVSLIDLMLLWGVLCLVSAALVDLREAGWLLLDWPVVLAPALLVDDMPWLRPGAQVSFLTGGVFGVQAHRRTVLSIQRMYRPRCLCLQVGEPS